MYFKLDKKLRNDIHFSIGFFFFFTAFNTQFHIQKALTVSIYRENPEYTVNVFISFGILYTILSLFMWVGPAIIVVLGTKSTFALGFMLCIPTVSFYYFENVFLTYLGTVLGGIGTALFWTAQVNYVVMNSEIGQVYLGSSLFWMLTQSSLISGNAFVYFQFRDGTIIIDRKMQRTIILVFVILILLSVAIIYSLQPPIRNCEDDRKLKNPLNEIKKSYQISTSKIGLIFSILFGYAGLHISFMSVIATSMGFSLYLSDNSKQYAALSGFVQGWGEVAACIFSLICKRKKFYGLLPVMALGCGGNLIAYLITFLGLPANSVFNYSRDIPIIPLSVYWLVVANFFVGAGDACLQIEIYVSLGTLCPNDSVPAFVSYKFIRSLAMAVSFYYGSVMNLTIQVFILMVFSICTFIAYHFVIYNLKELFDTSTKLSDTNSELN